MSKKFESALLGDKRVDRADKRQAPSPSVKKKKPAGFSSELMR